MQVFYLDEAGCTGMLPSATAPIQPVFLLGGIAIPQSNIKDFTLDWLHLKQRFFPRAASPEASFLDGITLEVKGADLRHAIRENNRNPRRHALGFMDKFVDFLRNYDARLFARIYIKPVALPFDGRSVYTSAVQNLSADFQEYLAAQKSPGLMVLDSRNKPLNTNVSHSVFTQKYRASGDAYPSMIEMPVFGHSDNHAGIQAADVLCSAFLFPMATSAYCLGRVNNVHVHPAYLQIRQRYGERLQQMQFRYQDASHRWKGGATVSDALGRQGGGILFKANNALP
jgi:hypothetical protein